MTLVPIENIRPGMILDQDIRDHNGRFLLGKGLTIQDKHLRIFKIWGISQVDVQGLGQDHQDGSPGYDSKVWQKTMESVLERFPGHDPENQASDTLLNIFTQHACHAQQPGCPAQDLTQPDADPGPPATPADPEADISRDLKLASLPRIFMLIQEAIQDPRTSSRHLADIISKDQGLAAKLLKLVNSAFYGFPSRIDTISRAVTIIGTRQLSVLALGVCAVSRFRNISPDILSMEEFWKHSIACAIGAKTLAGFRNLPNTESFFVCGLLHDIGKLIMLDYYPDHYLRTMIRARKTNTSLIMEEKTFFRRDHAALGARMVRRWKLPLKIEQAIRHHENPSASRFHMETTMVHMANILAIGCCIGSGGETSVHSPDLASWANVNLEHSVLIQTAKLMQSQVDNIYRLLFDGT
ncbi:HDOD domain-containing protein [Desulfonatronovibrio hydrogenovorans]|uniref:HDOD domain-containing protein n=1 Tax=Desulfonatronovibrio hydrogenovorans TaxID=53245 RepID=UPI000B01F1E8|nr:HDOD domain-containing protein [Desulfonatronovibrio hydrogenovorans]